MVHEHDITVIAGTTDANPQITRVKLQKGVIHKYEIYFPPGCTNLVYVRIKHGLYQVWPSNTPGTHKGDGVTLSFREHYELKTQPYEFTVVTSAPSATYNHTITVRFAVLPLSILTPWLLSWGEKLGLYAGGE